MFQTKTLAGAVAGLTLLAGCGKNNFSAEKSDALRTGVAMGGAASELASIGNSGNIGPVIDTGAAAMKLTLKNAVDAKARLDKAFGAFTNELSIQIVNAERKDGGSQR